MAIEFKLIGGLSNPEYKVLRTSGSQAYAIGDAVMLDRTADGTDVIPATSSTVTSNIYAVAVETIAATATSGLFCILKPDQYWQADTTNTATTNDNEQRMVLTDKGTVNNTHTDSTAGIFQQTGVISTTRIVGRFLVGYSAA